MYSEINCNCLKSVLDFNDCNEMAMLCLCSHQVIITKSRQNCRQSKHHILALHIDQLLPITRLYVLAILVRHSACCTY